jgi:hypothetical protein
MTALKIIPIHIYDTLILQNHAHLTMVFVKNSEHNLDEDIKEIGRGDQDGTN